MEAFMKLPNGSFVQLREDRIESMKSSIRYNPFRWKNGVVGFYMKGDRIVPVVDLNEKLETEGGTKRVFVIMKSVVFSIGYSSLKLEKPSGEEIDLEAMSREVLEDLGVI